MAEDICVIIPIYDNAGTIRDVASRALGHCKDVFVVDDGSHDSPGKELEGLPVRLVRHDRNQGKGKALKTGFKAARAAGFRKAITLDGDGQHYPEDLPAFFEMADKHPDTMLIGSRNLRMENMPGKNTFANKFSNFWFKVQTGVSLPDTQSGFRLYQLDKLGSLWYLTSRYEAELEMLVAQCWKRVEMVPVPIDVYYPPAGERVTHFRPFWDFFRISILNTILCILALLYGYPSKLLRKL